jgi:hypothetical protein
MTQLSLSRGVMVAYQFLALLVRVRILTGQHKKTKGKSIKGLAVIVPWCNGSISVSGTACSGSNPDGTT